MKLLIVTSEPLNPQNILSSTFELSQAKILKEKLEVSIISVSPPDSLSASVKAFFKTLFSPGILSGLKAATIRIRNIKSVLAGRGNEASVRYIIDGVSVYEGKNYKYFSKSGFSREVKDWVNAGLAAYSDYISQCGKPDLVHAHGRFMYAGALALEIKRQSAVPYIYTEHSSSYSSGTAPAAARPVLSQIINNASAVIAVSASLLKALETYLGRKIEGAVVMPNVLDPVFEAPAEMKNLQEQFKFISIASFLPIKGLDILLKGFKGAFNGNKKYQLTICGDGPLKNELSRLCDDLALQHCVFFAGNVSKERIREYLDNSNALVVSSSQETFGVAVIEALSRGCPVIATRCGGPEDILSEKTGILTDPENDKALSLAMTQMVTGYRNFNRDYLRTYAISHFGSKAFLESSLELYRHILN